MIEVEGESELYALLRIAAVLFDKKRYEADVASTVHQVTCTNRADYYRVMKQQQLYNYARGTFNTYCTDVRSIA